MLWFSPAQLLFGNNFQQRQKINAFSIFPSRKATSKERSLSSTKHPAEERPSCLQISLSNCSHRAMTCAVKCRVIHILTIRSRPTHHRGNMPSLEIPRPQLSLLSSSISFFFCSSAFAFSAINLATSAFLASSWTTHTDTNCQHLTDHIRANTTYLACRTWSTP